MHIAVFSLRRQMAPQQTAKFRTARFPQFRSILRKERRQLFIDLDAVFAVL